MRGPPQLSPIIGNSFAIRQVRDLIERYAPTSLPVLLVGATGTGKELVARHIHGASGREGQLVPVNCGALPRDMAEGLLFGFERGAFSGAVRTHRGHVECADRGTLLLDELLCLSLDGQAKLLRVLDTGEFQRLGAEIVRYADARLIGTVQEDVVERVSAGDFRDDLYQRLKGIVIELPPLRDRPEDIISLATHFATQSYRVLESDAAEELSGYTWPGNVRELALAIGRAGLLVEDGTLPGWAIRRAIETGSTRKHADDNSRNALLSSNARAALAACEQCAWNTTVAARTLGLSRSALYQRLKVAGISLKEQKQRRGAIGIPL